MNEGNNGQRSSMDKQGCQQRLANHRVFPLLSPLRLRRLSQRQICNHAEHDGHRREDDDVGPQRQHVEVELRHHLPAGGRARRERHCEWRHSDSNNEKESQRGAFNEGSSNSSPARLRLQISLSPACESHLQLAGPFGRHMGNRSRGTGCSPGCRTCI